MMKTKRLSALILSVLMVLAYLPVNRMTVYADGYTAQIGETQYISLAAAVEAASDGDTIQMIADEELSDSVTVAKSLTIDLNGHNVSYTAETQTWIRVLTIDGAGITVTVTDNSDLKEGSLSAIQKTEGQQGIGVVVKQGTFVLDNGSIKPSSRGIEIETASGAAIINGGIIESKTIARSFGSLEITGGELKGTKDSGIYQFEGSSTTVSGGIIEGYSTTFELIRGGANLTITGGEIKSMDYVEASAPIVTRDGGNTVRISGGTLSSKNRYIKNNGVTLNSGDSLEISGGKVGALTVVGDATDSDIAITGGYFSNDVSEYIEMPYMCISDTTYENYDYRVARMAAEVQSGTEESAYYESVADAVANADQGSLIKLLTDYEGTYKMTAGQTLVIDKNGFAFNDPTVDGDYVVRSTHDGSVYTYTVEKAPVAAEKATTEAAAVQAEIVDLPAVKITKPKAAKKKVTVNWKKISKKNLKKIQGIEIRVAGPGVDKVITAGKKKTSKKVGGLQPKQKYTVQVRAYAWIGGVKHVSAWKSKSVKVK